MRKNDFISQFQKSLDSKSKQSSHRISNALYQPQTMKFTAFSLLSAALVGLAQADLTTHDENQKTRQLPHFKTWDDVWYYEIEEYLENAKRQGACALDIEGSLRDRDSCYSVETARRQLRGEGERRLEDGLGLRDTDLHLFQRVRDDNGAFVSIAWATDKSGNFVAGMHIESPKKDGSARRKLEDGIPKPNFDDVVIQVFHVDAKMPGILSLREDTISGDPIFERVVAHLDNGVPHWPSSLPDKLQRAEEVLAIDELGCMAICLAGCVASDAGVPCWQLCSSACAWLILIPW